MSETQLLEALAQNEEALSHLYNIFSAQFPADAGIWDHLSAQETYHASIIRELSAEVAEGALRVPAGRFNKDGIELTTGYIRSLYSEAQGKDLPWAFNVSLDIEKSFLEHEFFTVFEADAQELKVVLNRLAEDTRRHFRMLEGAWKEFKANL